MNNYILGQSSGQGRWIKCLKCNRVSHNENDIQNRYCAYCKEFHEEDDNENDNLMSQLVEEALLSEQEDSQE